MIKYRLEITKGEPIRYISHLDFASLMQRAICRAHLLHSGAAGLSAALLVDLQQRGGERSGYGDCGPEPQSQFSRVYPRL